MSMKGHILAALQEQFAAWDGRLASLSEAEANAPRPAGRWTRREEVIHLWGWQQVTLARLASAAAGSEPQLPEWVALVPGGLDADGDVINAAQVGHFAARSWPTAYADWRAGFNQVIEAAAAFAEGDMIDGDRYPVLRGYSVADFLLATYGHHQDHMDTW